MTIEIQHGGCFRAPEQKAHFQQKMPRVKALEIYLDAIIVTSVLLRLPRVPEKVH